jgi:plasmid stabilization system protein ParE
MAHEIVWTAAAEADIEEIGQYLEKVASSAVATSVISRIRAAGLRCCDSPFAACMIPEFQDPNRRETFVHEWRLMYRVEDKHIHVLRVVHGRRLLKNVPGSFEEIAQEPYRAA